MTEFPPKLLDRADPYGLRVARAVDNPDDFVLIEAGAELVTLPGRADLPWLEVDDIAKILDLLDSGKMTLMRTRWPISPSGTMK